MFKLPSIYECCANKQLLINQWLCDKIISKQAFFDAKKFFEKCFVFHHFAIPDYTWEEKLRKGQIPKNLASGQIKSHAELAKSGHSELSYRTIDSLDVSLGLNRYVYFSFGAPIKNTGPEALIFSLPFEALLKNYKYPQIWVSWGDIFTLACEIFGKDFIYKEWISDSQFEELIRQYKRNVFLPEYIPEVAAFFAISNYKNKFEALKKRWFKFRSGYWGPEIKIENSFTLKHVSYCFIDQPDSPAGELAYALYRAGILNVEPIIDEYFHLNRFEDFYQSFS